MMKTCFTRFKACQFLRHWRFLSILLLLWIGHVAPAAVDGEWQAFSRGELSPQTMPVTTEIGSGKTWYLCRAHYSKGLHPGKLSPELGGCLITSAGRANRRVHYEVLIAQPDYVWEKYDRGALPDNAVQGGAEDANGDYVLYICRTKQQGRYQAGKIRSPARGCKIEADGRERTARDFELLLLQDNTPAEQQVFNAPRHQQQHLDNCRLPSTECGEPAASSWCQTQGYADAVQWSSMTHPPGISTLHIGDNSLCDGQQQRCNGFISITCQGVLEQHKQPLSFSGRWQTQRGEQMLTLTLSQDGEQVTGQFEHAVQGSLRGFLNEQELWGRWSEKDGRSGRFQWTLSSDGQRFQGISEEQQANFRKNPRKQERWQGRRLP